MKNLFKISIVLLIAIIMIFQTNIIYAEGEDKDTHELHSVENIKDNLDKFDPSDTDINSQETEFQRKAAGVIAVIRNVGVTIAVIALMILGVRELTASIDEKSVIKKSLPGYLLGVFLVVAITSLPSFIYELVKAINN